MVSRAAVSALILAGGQSSRMGCDKALIEWQGRSLLQRVYDTASGCCSTVYVVTQQPERYEQLLPTTCLWIQETYAQTGHSCPGPLVAFTQALPQTRSEWVLLLACDLPFLDQKTLQCWLEQAVKTEPPPIAWVPSISHRWEPLCAVYHRSCANSLHKFVSSGGRSFQAWLDSESVQPLMVNRPEMLHNCNTPDDVMRLQEQA